MLNKIKFSIFLILTFSVSFFTFSNTNLQNTIVDFDNNVIDFSETGLMDNVRSGEIVQLSPLDLKVGSIFIDVDGIAKKVVKIETVGNQVYIDTVQPELREVFEFYDIPEQTINLTLDDHLIMDNSLAGSTLTSNSRVGGTTTLEFEKTVGDDNASVTLGATATATVDVKVGARLPYSTVDTKGTWKVWKWQVKYYQGFAKGNIEYDFNLDGTLVAQAKLSKELNIPIFALTTGPGIDVGTGFFSNSSIEGSLTLTDHLEFNLKGNVGVSCGLDGLLIYCKPVNIQTYGSTEFSVKNTLSLEAQVLLKEKLYLGAWVKIFGFSVIEADAGGGPYLDFNAMIEGWLEYSTKTKFASNWSYSGSGEIGVFAEINASVFDGKWGGEIWAKKFPIYTISGSGGGKTISIQFDGDGATTVSDPESINLSSTETNIESLPTDPIKNGYKFGGWFTEKDGAGEQFSETTKVTKNTTVYANWIADPTSNLALNKTATASSTSTAKITILNSIEFSPDKAIDGVYSLYSQWKSKSSSNEEWIVIDLNEPADFKRIKLYFINTKYDYKVEWSNDKINWNLIAKDYLTSNSSSQYISNIHFDLYKDTFLLPQAVSGRYIRISAQDVLAVSEIQVFNGEEAPPSGGGG